MIIRKATIEDAEKIKELSDIWNKESFSVPEETMEEIKKPILKGNTLVAIINKDIIGYSSIRIFKARKDSYMGLKKGEKYISIDALYIKKEHRSSRVGSALLKTVEDEYAKPQNISQMTLITGGEHKKLMDFYAKNGFGVNYVFMQRVVKEQPALPAEAPKVILEQPKLTAELPKPIIEQKQMPAVN